MSDYEQLLRRRRRLLLVTCIGCWGWAMIATHLPTHRLPTIGSDLTVHAIGYMVLASLFWLTLRAYGLSPARRIAWTIFVMPAYACMDELTQPMFGRCAALNDWIADVAGALAALAVLETIGWALHRK